jgi:hypothetical protein
MLEDLVKLSQQLLIVGGGIGAVAAGYYLAERDIRLDRKEFEEQIHTKEILAEHYSRDMSGAKATILNQSRSELQVRFDLEDTRYIAKFQRIPLLNLMSFTRQPNEFYVLLETQEYPRTP